MSELLNKNTCTTELSIGAAAATLQMDVRMVEEFQHLSSVFWRNTIELIKTVVCKSTKCESCISGLTGECLILARWYYK